MSQPCTTLRRRRLNTTASWKAATRAQCADPGGIWQAPCSVPNCHRRSGIVDRLCAGNSGRNLGIRPHRRAGYWNRPEETERTFRAYLADSGEGPFLRTGDLGFLKDGELFVTGRLKDLIIIDGRNFYPHDIELTVEQSHPAIRSGCCAAFSVDFHEERLIVAAEVERRYQAGFQESQVGHNGTARAHPNGRPPLDVEAMVRAIRRAVAEEHDVRVHAAVLLRAGSLPRTPSGKVQRSVCQASFLNGTLATL